MIGDEVLRQAQAQGQRTAVRGDGWSLSYADLALVVQHGAHALAEIVPPSRAFAVVMNRRPEPITTLLAASLHGNPAILLREVLDISGLESHLRGSGATAVAVPQRLGRPGAGGVHTLLRPAGMDWIMRPDDDAGPLETGDFIAQLTSGSEGDPKLAVRTLDGVQCEIESARRRMSLDSSDRVVCGASLAHSYGLIGGLLAPLSAGAEVILAAGPDAVADAVIRHAPTVVIGLSSAYASLLDRPDTSPVVAGARLLLSAGAPLPSDIFGDFLSRFGVPIRQDYGTTETGTIAIDTSEPAMEGSVGAPMEHMEVRLRPSPNLPDGSASSGEIQVRSVATARGYLSDGEVVPCVDGEGWYATADGGWWQDGRLFVGRRLRPAIPTAQGPIRPEIIEDAIAAMPGVLEAVVLPWQATDGKPAVRLVVAGSGLKPASVLAWCRAYLPPEMVPAQVTALDELPRSPAGKILMKQLIALP